MSIIGTNPICPIVLKFCIIFVSYLNIFVMWWFSCCMRPQAPNSSILSDSCSFQRHLNFIQYGPVKLLTDLFLFVLSIYRFMYNFHLFQHFLTTDDMYSSAFSDMNNSEGFPILFWMSFKNLSINAGVFALLSNIFMYAWRIWTSMNVKNYLLKSVGISGMFNGPILYGQIAAPLL